jgi:hypothetical protein
MYTKAKMVKILSLTKYGPISRTAVFLLYRETTYLRKYVVLMGTMNFLFHLSHGCVRKFKSGVDSVKDIPHARRPKTATSPKMVKKVNARFITRYIAKCVSISVGASYSIIRRDLKRRRKSVRSIPHLFTKEKKTCSVNYLQTIVETVSLIQQSIFRKDHHWR